MKSKQVVIVFFITLICCDNCLSQQNNAFRSGYVGIGVGPSIPISQFASSKLGDTRSGFAETGLTLSLINLGYRFEYFELTTLLMSATHPTLQNTNNKKATWTHSGIFIGSVVPIDINKKLQTGFKVMIGAMATASPERVANGIILKSQQSTNLAIIGGFNIRYNVLERWCAIVDIYYLASNAKFDNYQQKIKMVNSAFGFGFRLR